jgi:hypothetical protein
MGNHDVGRALAGAAEGFWDGREKATKEQALSFLDKVAERWRGADAEFDDELIDGTSTALGRLVALAFDASAAELSSWDAWCDGPYQKFRARYEFC